MTPKSYKARVIEPGIISYGDKDMGVVLVDKTALDNMAATFKGCPVICVPELHNDSAPDNAFDFDVAKAPHADGIVTDCYWGDDGWYWANFLIWSEEAQLAIKKGFSVSCAYLPTETAHGGVWHNLPYDEEVTNGKYLHLAIVPKPRYEGSKIYENAKGGSTMNRIFKIIMGKEPAKEPEKKTVVNALPEVAPKEPTPPAAPAAPAPAAEPKGEEFSPETPVKMPDGTTVPLSELILVYQHEAGESAIDEIHEIEDTDKVELENGKQVTVGELKNCWAKKKNAAPAPVQNAAPGGDPQPKVVNVALKNAAAKTTESTVEMPETRAERFARGAARYSSAVAQEAK